MRPQAQPPLNVSLMPGPLGASYKEVDPGRQRSAMNDGPQPFPHASIEPESRKEVAMTRHRIAILVGSLRKDSINRKVARSICAFAGDKLDCEIVGIGELPLYDQDSDSDPPEAFTRFRERIAAVDGILFVTPEYNRGVPGVLK